MPKAERLFYYFDTVCISNFAMAHRLDLLTARYGRRLHVTQEALGEIIDGMAAGYSSLSAIEGAVTSGTIGLTSPFAAGERQLYQRLLRTLGSGEASCIVMAKTRKGIVATDDRAARECCAGEGVLFTGTIGILKACCRAGALTPQSADEVLQAMIEAGYHSPVNCISGLI